MKKPLFAIGLFLSGLIFSVSSVHAQYYEFDVPGNDGAVNVTGLAASGNVTYTFLDTIEVDIWNDSDSDIFDNTYIVGFYILKPWDADDDLDISLSLTSGYNANWEFVDGADGNIDALSGLPGVSNPDDYLYYGAAISNNPPGNGIPIASQEDNPLNPAEFLFTLGGDDLDELDFSVYDNQNNPHIVVRWKSFELADGVEPNDNGLEEGGSGKGYGYFTQDPPEIPPVPEPSQIAIMALLGMGGLLWIRKRISSRKSA